MKQNEIKELAENGKYHSQFIHGKIEETHISWVILTRRYAFKIKKPLKLSFLDFSTLRLRKKNCQLEIKLNNRFTNIYLAVLPLRLSKGKWIIGGEKGRIVDYAVQMKRMQTSRRMDKLLIDSKVTMRDMQTLANVVAMFHRNAVIRYTPFNLRKARNTFNDIISVRDQVMKVFGKMFEGIIGQAMAWSDSFLMAHKKRFQERINEGFKRDVHGDLHSGNIFLYRNPVLFDCIEFNDEYREIDVLYEIAFLCMDLEAFNMSNLASVFLSEYASCCHCFSKKEDEHIFLYFKCLRANVRAKVHAIQIKQAQSYSERRQHELLFKKYILLIQDYSSRHD